LIHIISSLNNIFVIWFYNLKLTLNLNEIGVPAGCWWLPLPLAVADYRQVVPTVILIFPKIFIEHDMLNYAIISWSSKLKKGGAIILHVDVISHKYENAIDMHVIGYCVSIRVAFQQASLTIYVYYQRSKYKNVYTAVIPTCTFSVYLY